LNFNTTSFVTVVGIVIILIAIGISTAVQQPPKAESLKVITAGPVWLTDSWSCTSDKDFVLHGALRGLDGSLLEINVSNSGTQSLYLLNPGELEQFTVGTSAGNSIIITRTGSVTGFLTMETASDAQAECTQI
jgi:hypothetical protein